MIQSVSRVSKQCGSSAATQLRRRLATTTGIAPRSIVAPFCGTRTNSASCCSHNSRFSRSGFISSRFFSSETSQTSTTAKDDIEVIEIKTNTPSTLRVPGAEKGGRKLAIVFTCTVCGTRSAKQFSEQAYQNGVVLVRCPGCQNLHLIADRLGYFEDESFDLDSLAAQTGEKIKQVDGTVELRLEDLVGEEKMQEILRAAGTKEVANKPDS